MFSIEKRRSIRTAVAGLALVTLSVEAGAEALVVRASGPSAGTFAPGRKIADGASITLKAGDVLTVLDGRGTRTLRGPGTFGASGGAAAAGSASIASFLGQRTTARARTGAVRGGMTAAAPRSPNLWYVDATKSSAVCVPDATNVKLWRPASTDAAALTITAKGRKAAASFAAGQSLIDWPVADAPITEGAAYQLTGPGLAQPVSLRFTLLAPTADGIEGTASTLIARKCQAQLDLLVETVALPDAAPDMPS